MNDEVVVAVVGAKITNTKKRNGATGRTNVGSGRGHSGRFVDCCTFHPSSAAEGRRVEGGALEDVTHVGDSGDVPTGEITGEG